MRTIVNLMCLPLFGMGWISGFLFRYLWNGWLHGLYYFELSEEKRKQAIIKLYANSQMKNEQDAFAQLVPGIKIYNTDKDIEKKD